jgi:hypothetical protein
MRRMTVSSTTVAVALLILLVVPLLICVGCTLRSGPAETSTTMAKTASNPALDLAIKSALDHVRAASDTEDDINQRLQLCEEAYDIKEPDRAVSYAEDAQGLLPKQGAELATAQGMLTSVETMDGDADLKRHARLLLDWVESRIAEAAALSRYISAEKVVAAAGASLTDAQVTERYGLKLELLKLQKTVDEKVDTANDFSRVQLAGQSSTTVPVSDALLAEYDYSLRAVTAWRDAIVDIGNLRTYKYNETGPNRKIKPSDLIVKELETLVARMDGLPTPPPSLAALDSAWRTRVAQQLEAERALAQKDTQKHRDDRIWYKGKEYAAINELTAMASAQIALIDTTPATTQVTTTTEATTATTAASELSPEIQACLIEFNRLGQLYWDTWVKLDAANSTNAIEKMEAMKNRPASSDVLALYNALATSAKNVSFPKADSTIAHLKDDFISACESVLKSEKLSQEATDDFGAEDMDIKEISEEFAAARAAFEASDTDFQAFRADLEALGVDVSWGK